MIMAEILLHLPLEDNNPRSGVWAVSQQGFKPSTTCRSLSLPGIPDRELTGGRHRSDPFTENWQDRLMSGRLLGERHRVGPTG